MTCIYVKTSMYKGITMFRAGMLLVYRNATHINLLTNYGCKYISTTNYDIKNSYGSKIKYDSKT